MPGTAPPGAAALRLQGVSKRYWQMRDASLLRSLIPLWARPGNELWALRDLDVEVAPGETVGVVGSNGAGKSSLLRLLAGVSAPSAGSVEIRGRVAPLLSVGVGFHPEMSGRENVFVNGMLLGLTRQEIRARFQQIVEFAELADFIDTPVKFYSSGMFMRLGFAVAINVRPDILLVDEVLAVGDVGFQLRCLERMRELQGDGTAIVFVSHSMQAVHLLCSRTLVLDHGRLVYDGGTDAGIAAYHRLVGSSSADSAESGGEILTRALERDGAESTEVKQGDEVVYRTVIRLAASLDGPGVVLRLVGDDGTLAYSMQTPVGQRWRRYEAGELISVEARFHCRLGGGGTYRARIDLTDHSANVVLSDVDGLSFFVPPLLGVSGPADLDASITVDGEIRSIHEWARFGGEPLDRRGGQD